MSDIVQQHFEDLAAALRRVNIMATRLSHSLDGETKSIMGDIAQNKDDILARLMTAKRGPDVLKLLSIAMQAGIPYGLTKEAFAMITNVQRNTEVAPVPSYANAARSTRPTPPQPVRASTRFVQSIPATIVVDQPPPSSPTRQPSAPPTTPTTQLVVADSDNAGTVANISTSPPIRWSDAADQEDADNGKN